VFHLNVVPFSFMAEASDPAWHSADPLDQIQIVRALVQQYAAAFSVPGSPPAAGIVIALGPVPVCDDPVDSADGAQLPALYHIVHSPVNAVGSLVKHHGKDHIA